MTNNTLFRSAALSMMATVGACDAAIEQQPQTLTENVQGNVASSSYTEAGIRTELRDPTKAELLANLEWNLQSGTARFIPVKGATQSQEKTVNLKMSPSLALANLTAGNLWKKHVEQAGSTQQAYSGCWCDYSSNHGVFCCCDYGLFIVCDFNS